jgi:Ribbon-helix-helix protein, copG family
MAERMVPVTFHLTSSQTENVAVISKEEGVSQAEVIRRALDSYFLARQQTPKMVDVKLPEHVVRGLAEALKP